MAGFTFCCGDFVNMMDAKGTVTAEILDMIKEDPRVCYINSDSTVGRVAAAMKDYPDRILDPGIQEMNMVTIAAGLAKEGYIQASIIDANTNEELDLTQVVIAKYNGNAYTFEIKDACN